MKASIVMRCSPFAIEVPRIARAVALCALLWAPGAALSEDKTPSHATDEIFARKILMDTIDSHMNAVDWMLSADKPVDLPQAAEHIDTVSAMLMAFPHLFPPDTNQWQPNVKRDPARDTFAAPELWANFDDFYRQAAATSRMAFELSRTNKEAEFRSRFADLREACEACHDGYVKSDE